MLSAQRTGAIGVSFFFAASFTFTYGQAFGGVDMAAAYAEYDARQAADGRTPLTRLEWERALLWVGVAWHWAISQELRRRLAELAGCFFLRHAVRAARHRMRPTVEPAARADGMGVEADAASCPTGQRRLAVCLCGRDVCSAGGGFGAARDALCERGCAAKNAGGGKPAGRSWL
jgi:hypothetical protein